jgi:hypothetical protein
MDGPRGSRGSSHFPWCAPEDVVASRARLSRVSPVSGPLWPPTKYLDRSGRGNLPRCPRPPPCQSVRGTTGTAGNRPTEIQAPIRRRHRSDRQSLPNTPGFQAEVSVKSPAVACGFVRLPLSPDRSLSGASRQGDAKRGELAPGSGSV